MKLSMEVKQLTPEFWLVTLRISEDGKMDTTRDFVVTQGQLNFLGTLVSAASGGREG